MSYKYTGPTQLCINNQWVDSVSGKKFKTLNPANHEVIAEVSEADKADVDKAVVAARRAFQSWRNVDGSVRSSLLLKLADLLEAHSEEFYKLESTDNGKPENHTKIDLHLVVECIRYFAGWAYNKSMGQTVPTEGDYFGMTLHEPIGVVGAIIPWNFPLLMWAWKIAPAIATGCTIVMKPAEQTPLSALWAQQFIIQAGFPPGVVNVLPGYGPTAGAAISEHMDIDKVAFTGSGEIGRVILAAAAKSNLKSVTLELGGKSPLIIESDADIEKAVGICMFGLFFNQGQCCCASSRIYCHASIYDKFVAAITEAAKKRKVGDPSHPDTEQGAQVDDVQFEKIQKFIESGKKVARLCAGGERHGDTGYFIQPTVFADVPDDAEIAREEIFGPVMSIMKFNTMEEVILRANDTTYGLAAGVVTNDLTKALTYAKVLRAGTVWVNCWDAFQNGLPFGGFKQSGIGRELGLYALSNFTQVKSVTIALPKYTHPIEVQGKL
jgi:aldehyde dehydrogenase (NAD+)